MRLADQFGQPQEFFISSGFLEAQPHTVTILADPVLRAPEMDEASARAAIGRTRRVFLHTDCDRLTELTGRPGTDATLIYAVLRIICLPNVANALKSAKLSNLRRDSFASES